MGGRLSKPGASVRTFIAVPIPRSVQDELGRVQDNFVGHASVLKWVNPDLLHITLRFLGATPAERLQAVRTAVCNAAAELAPFTLRLSGLGAFPSISRPRVVWAGLAGGAGLLELEHLYDLVERGLEAHGFAAEERAFSPHITLARTRDTMTRDDRAGLAATLDNVKARTRLEQTFDVDRVHVMRSDPRPAGPVYTPIATLALDGKGAS
ncbi:MAG TPA: RNA 2',3'-cyclic phosphodiesterase [Chloroflexota bacterium]|nr:RNA 2',3'-cyclic phosphodiesterase [Chloroflexota bacterium]